ncbi:hypothetical protein Godav_017763 [Gossypium davidsonii]|uniref:Uncharacterized protein n=1 Tax=Gossypium davidsonii TaxID=34287 RepID=A0A7J8QU95_GOSDV|nr:hypothetical protein [Gossypium davidsonii]
MLNWCWMGIFKVEDEINYNLCLVEYREYNGDVFGLRCIGAPNHLNKFMHIRVCLRIAEPWMLKKRIQLQRQDFFETLQRLSLHEKENVELVLDGDVEVEDEINYDLFLVGKFLGEMMVNFNDMKCTLLAL